MDFSVLEEDFERKGNSTRQEIADFPIDPDFLYVVEASLEEVTREIVENPSGSDLSGADLFDSFVTAVDYLSVTENLLGLEDYSEDEMDEPTSWQGFHPSSMYEENQRIIDALQSLQNLEITSDTIFIDDVFPASFYYAGSEERLFLNYAFYSALLFEVYRFRATYLRGTHELEDLQKSTFKQFTAITRVFYDVSEKFGDFISQYQALFGRHGISSTKFYVDPERDDYIFALELYDPYKPNNTYL